MYRPPLLLALFTLFALFTANAQSIVSNINKDDMDHSINPGDDFYRYANGRWLQAATIPPGRTGYDMRAMIHDQTGKRVLELIQHAASSRADKGSVAQQVGDYYATFMNEDVIEANGMAPLAREMALISAITNNTSLSAYLGTTLNSEVDGLITNSDHIFGLLINQGFEDAGHNVVHFLQGGLAMPERDNYLDPSPKMAELRTQYQAHIAAVLKLAGITEPDIKAARILSLETRIAQSFAPDADAADTFKQNNPWKREDFSLKAPGINWNAYFQSAGLAQQSDFIVWQPSAVTGVSALVAGESTDVWKDYLRFHLIEHYADILPRAVAAQHFAFYGLTLSGAQQPPDRVSFSIAATNGALGQAVGELYTQRYFPPEARAKAQTMAATLITAFHNRISNLAWMSPLTKQKALAKLAAFEIYIGYPDTWIDYSSLNIIPGDLSLPTQ